MDKGLEIYFAGSIRGGRRDVETYMGIIDYLGNYGKVLTEHVGDKRLSNKGEKGLSDKMIHDRDMGWLGRSKVVVAEVTNPSLGVGYEIGRRVERDGDLSIEYRTPILCLYRSRKGKRLSAMVGGTDGNVTNRNYKNLNEAKIIIDEFFDRLGHNKKL